MSDEGFFTGLVNDVERLIKEHFSESSIIDVRNVRHLMEIPSRNRSKTAFLAKALDNLSKRGILTKELVGSSKIKRYKKVTRSNIDEFLKKEN
jgi:hypothetical protein